jgi:hypothetical protein
MPSPSLPSVPIPESIDFSTERPRVSVLRLSSIVVSDSRRWLGRGRVLQIEQQKARLGLPTQIRPSQRENARSPGELLKRRLQFSGRSKTAHTPTAALDCFRTRGLPAIGWKLVSIRDAHSFSIYSPNIAC